MGQQEVLKTVREVLTKYMEARQMRKTHERYALLEYVYNYDGHFDVDTFYKHLKENGCNVSRATVYNTLEVFLDAGLVRKHHFTDKTAHYEKAYFNKSHDHLIILNDEGEIEEILEFCNPRIESIKSDLEKFMNVKIENHDLYLYAKKKTK